MHFLGTINVQRHLRGFRTYQAWPRYWKQIYQEWVKENKEIFHTLLPTPNSHYDDVIMSEIASQITSLTIVYSTVLSGADQSKHQSSTSLTGLCVGNSPVTGEFPAQMARNAENISIWWRHHALPKLHTRAAEPSLVNFSKHNGSNCPACRTTLIATRFRVAVICPIIQWIMYLL